MIAAGSCSFTFTMESGRDTDVTTTGSPSAIVTWSSHGSTPHVRVAVDPNGWNSAATVLAVPVNCATEPWTRAVGRLVRDNSTLPSVIGHSPDAPISRHRGRW